jgi:CDP-diacylglycerol--inositol 3-phosphatidyltransferase
MSYHPKYCTIAYGISCLLDAADGHAARMLGQSSKFGAVLDMVTDRYVSLRVLTYSQLMLNPAVPHHHSYATYALHTLSGPWLFNFL